MVVWGGEKVFAAGADIKEMRAMSYEDMVDRSRGLQDAFTAVASIPKPVVAAVNGYALGGGCELALCADFRIAAENAKLGQPEILLGLIPGAGGTQRLARLVGPSRAKDLIFTGRTVDAQEALALGLVDRVVPAEEVYAQAAQWARRLARGPAYALRAAKEAVDGGLETDLQLRPRPRTHPVRRPVRDRRPGGGDAQLRGGRPGQGHVRLSSFRPGARFRQLDEIPGLPRETGPWRPS